MKRVFPFIAAGTTELSAMFDIEHPEMSVTFENIMAYINGIFVFRVKPFGVMPKQHEDETEKAEADKKIVRLKGSVLLYTFAFFVFVAVFFSN